MQASGDLSLSSNYLQRAEREAHVAWPGREIPL